MKIKVKNLGILKQAEFELGDMTILCGGNNTGKTYATYALFGFLLFIFQYYKVLPSMKIPAKEIDQLFTNGIIHLDIADYVKHAPETFANYCKVYTEELLSIVFAASKDKFAESEFLIEINSEDIHPAKDYQRRIANNNYTLAIDKTEDNVVITLFIKQEKIKADRKWIELKIDNTLNDIVFNRLFPRPFIASAERTGAAIFRKELNFARNRLLEKMNRDKNADPRELLSNAYQDYALPVKENVDFIMNLETIAKNNSFIKDSHPDILIEFADIIGGEYTVTRYDELYYIPKGKSKHIKLTMDESSSAVRSLLDIGFYLKHIAQPGDLLMVDEPELNLHPENQRRVARLFARLVNLGIKVFITTHSDYIIKELNTLIMLNHDRPHLQKIAQQEGYKPEELLSASQIKVYIAEEALVKLEGASRKTRCQTLIAADIDPELGIEARSFDSTIETMNRIQGEIVWASE